MASLEGFPEEGYLSRYSTHPVYDMEQKHVVQHSMNSRARLSGVKVGPAGYQLCDPRQVPLTLLCLSFLTQKIRIMVSFTSLI